MGDASQATARKRLDLQMAIQRLLAPERAVRGVVAIGSVATGHARDGSDIDAVVFMEPVDPYVVPAESIWCPSDNSFHSIFTDDRRVQEEGIQLDLKHLDYRRWSSACFEWPEPQRASLAEGWLAFDRDGAIQRLVSERTAYDDVTRVSRLDQSVGVLAQLLGEGTPEENWDRLGPLHSFGRLAAASEGLVDALFALNRRWRGWRDRETEHLCRLPWLPADFERLSLPALNAPSICQDGFAARVAALRQMYAGLLARLQEEGFYGPDPEEEAFVRSHDEPGRAWNMDEWNRRHRQREG
ncbi:MAG: nucleotidyltransferase domain-containing protein [Anaerolineae bacterium]